MHFEVEQKYPITDLAQLEQRLSQLGAATGPSQAQIDRYYAHPARDFAATDEALRIRRVGEANFVTYKGPKVDATTKTRREIELSLPAGDEGFQQFAALLLALGFSPVAEVRKGRRKAIVAWEGCQVEAALDEVEHVGNFVELEISATEDQLDRAKASLASLANRLELREAERRSYLELLLTKGTSSG